MATPRTRNRFAGRGDFIKDSGSQKWLNIFGDVQIIKGLKRLENAKQRGVLKKAIGKALKVVVAVAQQNAPEDTGLLKDSIKAKVTRMVSGKVYVDPMVFAIKNKMTGGEFKQVQIAGPARGMGYNAMISQFKKHGGKTEIQKPANYAHIIEFGSQKRNIAPRPFMRSAMAASRNRMLEIIAAETRKGLEKLARKAG